MKPILFFLVLMSACNGSKVSTDQSIVNFDVLIENAIGGSVSEGIIIVSDPNKLEEIYTIINKNQEPGFDIPEVNFETESVIVFFLGEKNTGGYSISVKSINESLNNISIFYQENGPKPTDMVTMVVTQPYCIIKIKRQPKELKFIKVD